MTIYPRHRVEHAHGMFWRPRRKCAHTLHGNRKGKPGRPGGDIGDEQRNHVKLQQIRSSRERLGRYIYFFTVF